MERQIFTKQEIDAMDFPNYEFGSWHPSDPDDPKQYPRTSAGWACWICECAGCRVEALGAVERWGCYLPFNWRGLLSEEDDHAEACPACVAGDEQLREAADRFDERKRKMLDEINAEWEPWKRQMEERARAERRSAEQLRDLMQECAGCGVEAPAVLGAFVPANWRCLNWEDSDCFGAACPACVAGDEQVREAADRHDAWLAEIEVKDAERVRQEAER